MWIGVARAIAFSLNRTAVPYRAEPLGTSVQTAYVSHPACRLHDMGSSHPECPQRLAAVEDGLIAAGVYSSLQRHRAPRATREQLVRVHTEGYIDAVAEAVPQEGRVWLDADTAMNPHTLEAALRAAGALVRATDLVLDGRAGSAFCNVRPPGHHAMPDRAMGFCLFNNVAVGTAHALAAWGLERVAIADFDVHHGNGTEAVFQHDPRVMLCSTFQHPFYPFCGADSGSAHMINVPLAAGTAGARFRAAVAERWLPALEAFRPQLMFVCAGFDAHREDGMADLRLVEADYAWVTERVKEVAARWAQGRIVSALEGGYSLAALGRSAAAHVRVLCGL